MLLLDESEMRGIIILNNNLQIVITLSPLETWGVNAPIIIIIDFTSNHCLNHKNITTYVSTVWANAVMV